MIKYVVGIVVVALLAVGVYLYTNKSASAPASAPASAQTAFAPAVEKVLADQTAILQTLAEDPIVVAEVLKSNIKNKDLTKEQISTIDQDWQSSRGITPFIKTFLENATAGRLLSFQKEHPGFKEIFSTDIYGLNVGQTDKTSDYLQSDESWWTDSFAGGKGKTAHGSIEFDASSQTQAISLFVPIRDSSGGAIGVMKGVLDISSIGNAL